MKRLAGYLSRAVVFAGVLMAGGLLVVDIASADPPPPPPPVPVGGDVAQLAAVGAVAAYGAWRLWRKR